MIQFYFLSVLLNLIAGLMLIYSPAESGGVESDDFSSLENDASSGSVFDNVKNAVKSDGVFSSDVFRLITGVLSLFVGFIKLFFAYGTSGAGMAFFGDFIPAFAGIFGGASLLLSYYEERSADISVPEIADVILIDNRMYIGICCAVAAILHFIFPAAIIL